MINIGLFNIGGFVGEVIQKPTPTIVTPTIKGNPVENVTDAINPFSIIGRKFFGLSVHEAKSKLKKGDHISVQRFGYTHHSIYIGDGKVIHYLEDGIQEDSLYIFSDDSNINLESTPIKYAEEEVVKRAKSRLYEDNYNVIWKNCEQFAIWCRTDSNLNIKHF